MKNKKIRWFKGKLSGYIEKGELTLDDESKLLLIKENNKRIKERNPIETKPTNV